MNNYHPSFSTGTTPSTKEIHTDSFPQSTVDDLGRIYLASKNSTYGIKITRLNSDRTKDSTFVASGEKHAVFNHLRSVAIQ